MDAMTNTATARRRIRPQVARPVPPQARNRAATAAGRPVRRVPSVLAPWLRAQSLNVKRHAAALRPFQRTEFGPGPAAPTEGHIQAVNQLLAQLRASLLSMSSRVTEQVNTAISEPTSTNLRRTVIRKEHAHSWVQTVERVWDFYFELFGQRQSRFGDWLLSCDRIALDCYQAAYMGLGVAKSIPAPPAFSYMRTGFSPATFRRGIRLRRLGQINPFPLIQLPYHRLVNPWTLGAVLHEVSHNLQNDLGLARSVPRNIARRLMREGHSPGVAAVWSRWNRELYADVSGLLLGGPAVVASLMDVIGRGPNMVFSYSPRAPHPTPYLRTYISIELLRRMDFPAEAEQYDRAWSRIYPDPRVGNIPAPVLRNFRDVIALVVDSVCFQPYPELGNKSLSEVIRFRPKEQHMVEEAAQRLAAGTDPGVIPARFLIGASRFALDRNFARPGAISKSFYTELVRR
ncbi:MAG TPA: hypothetical protein VM409_08705 [Chloroflexia bacterium]|nr:hypothetical protein [Chloroflexia bacterium]